MYFDSGNNIGLIDPAEVAGMSIKDKYSIDSIIKELELVLQIDGAYYEETILDNVIAAVKTNINRQYFIDLSNNKITDIDLSISKNRTAVRTYIDNAAVVHAKLCGLAHINRFLCTDNINLPSVNYLGFTEESLRALLRVLQVETEMPRAAEAIEAIKVKLGTIDICREKRLLTVLVVAHAIGFNEIVAAVAEIIYQSMV